MSVDFDSKLSKQSRSRKGSAHNVLTRSYQKQESKASKDENQKKSFFQKIHSGEKLSQTGSRTKKRKESKSTFHLQASPERQSSIERAKKGQFKFKISRFQGYRSGSKQLNSSSIAQSKAEVAAMRLNLAQSLQLSPQRPKSKKMSFERRGKRRRGVVHPNMSPEKVQFAIRTKKMSQSVEIKRKQLKVGGGEVEVKVKKFVRASQNARRSRTLNYHKKSKELSQTLPLLKKSKKKNRT